jgi:hypothetical protein
MRARLALEIAGSLGEEVPDIGIQADRRLAAADDATTIMPV